jgi:hypothetical protein
MRMWITDGGKIGSRTSLEPLRSMVSKPVYGPLIAGKREVKSVGAILTPE